MTKREAEVHSEFAEDEIDIFQYLTQLAAYWKRIVLITIIAGVASLIHFSSTKPPPQSSLELEIGFKNINIGEYPDGSVFSMSDLNSDTITEKVFKRFDELSSYGLSLKDYKDSFLVKPIYPFDIRLAMKNLERVGDKLSTAEMVAQYDIVRGFVPRNYSIKFSPPVKVPEDIREKVFREIVLEYSAYVNNNRLPDMFMVESLPRIDSENSSIPFVFDRLYSYFSSLRGIVEDMKSAEARKIKISISSTEERKRKIASGSFKFTQYGFRFGNLGLIDSIQENLALLESIIFDEMGTMDIERYKRSQLALLKNLEFMAEKLGKRANFRFRLAKLPTEMPKDLETGLLGAAVETKGSDVVGSLPDQSSVIATGTLIGILLSYNKHYYSLMNEAENLFDQKVEMESTIKFVKDRLERIGSAKQVAVPGEELNKKAESLAISIRSQLKEVAEELDKMVIDYFVKYEPPVKKYFVLHGSSNTPYKKVVVTVIFAFLASIIFQVILISFKQWKERKTAE